MWINGGPGSDSLVGLFGGFGPCNVINGTTEINPHSWNNVSNMLFLSQPVGVGFSYADIQPGYIDEVTGEIVPTDEADATGAWPVPAEPPEVDTSESAAVAAWKAVQAFYEALPDLDSRIKSKKFHLWTQSWGGRYGPAFFRHFYEQNEKIAMGAATGIPLELGTLGIGNGYIDPILQAESLPAFAVNNTYGIAAYNATVHSYAQLAVDMPRGCRAQALACRKQQQAAARSPVRDAICARAWAMCYDSVQDLVRVFSDRDRFDLRERPGSYACLMLPVVAFLNRADVQNALGVASNYTPESAPVLRAFDRAGDGVLGDFVADIGFLLNCGLGVTLYHGDADYVCNWIGGEVVSLAVNYTRADAFRSSTYEPFVVDGNEHGLARQAGNFSFLRVYEAGHMVPLNQPRAALELFNRSIHGLDLATGLVPTG
ncbi:Cytochrome P450 [Macrophomina phaseolina MS6]|uniref:Cytochrome P450 n=1 Tax=Macrophomina phaseolina (strain MS6) TaxID=1126212 RepID=K2RN81_MACPH|nr:Cytochrome P450 [Macrophomina phaseolina MS6]